MIKQAIILHGTMGHPKGNWFPWLKDELEKMYINTVVPELPTPDGQTLQNWTSIFDKEVGSLTENHILIGHSVSVSFILNLLQRDNKKIAAAFLVAGFIQLLPVDDFNPYIKSFVEKPFNWRKIKNNCNYFKVYAGDHDPYVPLVLGQEIANALDVDLTVIKDGGHINHEAGFTSLQILLDDIKHLVI